MATGPSASADLIFATRPPTSTRRRQGPRTTGHASQPHKKPPTASPAPNAHSPNSNSANRPIDAGPLTMTARCDSHGGATTATIGRRTSGEPTRWTPHGTSTHPSAVAGVSNRANMRDRPVPVSTHTRPRPTSQPRRERGRPGAVPGAEHRAPRDIPPQSSPASPDGDDP
jgi:hypothetical protein